jgi:hypothetical protein
MKHLCQSIEGEQPRLRRLNPAASILRFRFIGVLPSQPLLRSHLGFSLGITYLVRTLAPGKLHPQSCHPGLRLNFDCFSNYGQQVRCSDCSSSGYLSGRSFRRCISSGSITISEFQRIATQMLHSRDWTLKQAGQVGMVAYRLEDEGVLSHAQP